MAQGERERGRGNGPASAVHSDMTAGCAPLCGQMQPARSGSVTDKGHAHKHPRHNSSDKRVRSAQCAVRSAQAQSTEQPAGQPAVRVRTVALRWCSGACATVHCALHYRCEAAADWLQIRTIGEQRTVHIACRRCPRATLQNGVSAHCTALHCSKAEGQ